MNTAARVDSYTRDFDADHAKAYLESHDIVVRLEGEPLNSATFAVGPILGGSRLYVEEEDGERAQVLLSNYHEQMRTQHLATKEHPDHLVTRACIAAFIGFVTIPLVLHAYSVWMLLSLDKERISPEKRYRYPLAWAGDALAFALLFTWLAVRIFG
jgi:hypothetical protein